MKLGEQFMKDRRVTFIPPLVLVLVGGFCWYIAGRVTGMASFKDADEVLLDYPGKVANIWALCGGIAGLLAYIYFLIRPREHRPVTPQIARRRGAPKTVVEAKMGMLIMNLGLLTGIFLPLLFPPKSAITGSLVGRSTLVRVLVGCLTTFFAGGVVIPISFWLMTKIMVRK
jgi:hypothetical protein